MHGEPSQSAAEPRVLADHPLGNPWPGLDPFLFCAHHLDQYPAGDGQLGLAPTHRAGRDIGMDFSRRDGFSMYHGERVPGFPGHPHRGFETVTIVPRGLVDHADSLGAKARYGDGDVQWLTAGRGVQHAEMFPLPDAEHDNPLDLFQIWLNLPARDKMVPPDFRMLWGPAIARAVAPDAAGRMTEVVVVAGDYRPVPIAAAGEGGSQTEQNPPAVHRALAPPPNSWANQAQADVAIWLLRLAPGAALTLPPALDGGVGRTLYFHTGSALAIGTQRFGPRRLLQVDGGRDLPLRNLGDDPVGILMLQGRPIGEPVAARGPFVMNTEQELRQTMDEYRRTRFGGWPWPDDAPTHGHEGRFAQYPDGRVEHPPA